MGRLKSGQKAASVHAREQAIDTSIQQRVDFLAHVARQNHLPDGFTAHRSIKALCEWTDASAGISPVSRNTLKSRKAAFSRLLELQGRLRATERNHERTSSQKTRHDSNADLRRRNAVLKYQLQQLADALVEQRAAYLDLLAEHQAAAQHDKAKQAAIKRHHARYPLRTVTDRVDNDTIAETSDAESKIRDLDRT